MKFKDVINNQVLNSTGFDVPELGGNEKLSRIEVFEALKRQKRWHDDFAIDCQNQIDRIIKNNFTIDERLDWV